MSVANRLRTWGPAALWAAALFFLSSVPDVGEAARLPVGDKLVHVVLYAVFGVTLAWAGRSGTGRGRHELMVVLGVLYGAGDEWHQAFVPGRSPEVADWVADSVGVLIGYGTTAMLLGRTKIRHTDRGEITQDG